MLKIGREGPLGEVLTPEILQSMCASVQDVPAKFRGLVVTRCSLRNLLTKVFESVLTQCPSEA